MKVTKKKLNQNQSQLRKGEEKEVKKLQKNQQRKKSDQFEPVARSQHPNLIVKKMKRTKKMNHQRK